jgi:hypothetical protein
MKIIDVITTVNHVQVENVNEMKDISLFAVVVKLNAIVTSA